MPKRLSVTVEGQSIWTVIFLKEVHVSSCGGIRIHMHFTSVDHVNSACIVPRIEIENLYGVRHFVLIRLLMLLHHSFIKTYMSISHGLWVYEWIFCYEHKSCVMQTHNELERKMGICQSKMITYQISKWVFLIPRNRHSLRMIRGTS